MKVKRNTLLLIAALVWSAAGFNILRIGLLAYPPYRTIVNYLLSAVVFTVFQIFIFGRLVNKHTARISAYEEELHFFLKFFDVKSFIIMAVMMTGGIWLIQRRGPGLVHLVFLLRTGHLPPAGGTAVRLQLRQGGPRRQGQGVILEIRPAWSSFETEISKLLFFVSKMAPSWSNSGQYVQKGGFCMRF